MSIQYQMSRIRPGVGIVSAPYETHVGHLVNSLYNQITMTLSYYPYSCRIKEHQFRILRDHHFHMSKWYFHLDITPNTLRFSIYQEEVYTEPVKALDDQNQSILIVTSISGASLKLRPNTPTLNSDFHRHIVILSMEVRRGLSKAKLFWLFFASKNRSM